MRDMQHPNNLNIKLFLTHLAVCQTVVADVKEGKTLYNASSPDELALMNKINNIEVEVQGRT